MARQKGKCDYKMNIWTGIGRLTRDPEVRYSANNTAVASFTLAIDDVVNGEKRTNFIPITVFGKQAENIEKYLGKGNLCAVNGKLQTGSYTNSEGVKIKTTDIIANRVKFLEWKKKEDVTKGFTPVDDNIPF